MEQGHPVGPADYHLIALGDRHCLHSLEIGTLFDAGIENQAETLRRYCVGEHAMTRLKAALKALSDS